jgi:protein-L-isoaspartate(D-aspartate) O-methyltransferase
MRFVHQRSQRLDMTYESHRRRLLGELRKQGIRDERVLAALAKVPRHEFIEEALRSRAYENNALPIGLAQTISQPYIVALMTEALLGSDAPPEPQHPGKGDRQAPVVAHTPRKLRRVLEVGTGCGYQTAVLAELVPAVFSVERLKRLSEQARLRLSHLGYHNILFSYADGALGWPTYAPFDGILVTAASPEVPKALIEQLAVGGRLVIPVGPNGQQQLKLVERTVKGVKSRELCGVSFVPLLSGRG